MSRAGLVIVSTLVGFAIGVLVPRRPRRAPERFSEWDLLRIPRLEPPPPEPWITYHPDTAPLTWWGDPQWSNPGVRRYPAQPPKFRDPTSTTYYRDLACLNRRHAPARF